MNKIVLSLIFAFITLIVLFLGYSYFNGNNDKTPVTVQDQNTQIYQFAKPQYGNFIKTIEADAIFNNSQDIGMFSVDSSVLENLKIGQDIILKDKNGETLPLAGKINTIRNHNNGADILFTLPDQTDTAQLSQLIEVIIFESNALKLIPVSSLQKDEDTLENFVWGIEKQILNSQTDKAPSINKIKITTPYQNNTHFAVKTNDEIFYLINPHKNITESLKDFDYKIINISTPNHNPIYESWINYNAAKLELAMQDIEASIEACGNANNGDNGDDASSALSNGDSCADAQSTIISAEEIFSTIQNMKDGNTNAQNACGDTPSIGNCN